MYKCFKCGGLILVVKGEICPGTMPPIKERLEYRVGTRPPCCDGRIPIYDESEGHCCPPCAIKSHCIRKLII